MFDSDTQKERKQKAGGRVMILVTMLCTTKEPTRNNKKKDRIEDKTFANHILVSG